MKGLFIVLAFAIYYLIVPSPVLAVSTDSELVRYTNDTLQIITLISTAAAVFFLVKGGYSYLTSTGRPDALEGAKKTLRNAVIGLVIVLSANIVVSTFRSALNPDTTTTSSTAITFAPIETTEPSDGLTQVLIDAVSAWG